MFKLIGAIVALICLIFALPLIGTALGAFTGWVVGLIWPNTFAAFLAHFGLAAFAPWKVGALLGFIGGFFKASLTNNKSE